jgi:hypothetical protein
MEVLSRLRRTMLNIFGVGDINIKDNSGTVELRNKADDDYVSARVKENRYPDGGFEVTVKAPSLLDDVNFTLPTNEGTNEQGLATDGAGNLYYEDFSLVGHTHDASDIVSGTLVEERGGTGNDTYVVGDILVATDTTTLSRLPVGEEGKLLTIKDSEPSWQDNWLKKYRLTENLTIPNWHELLIGGRFHIAPNAILTIQPGGRMRIMQDNDKAHVLSPILDYEYLFSFDFDGTLEEPYTEGNGNLLFEYTGGDFAKLEISDGALRLNDDPSSTIYVYTELPTNDLILKTNLSWEDGDGTSPGLTRFYISDTNPTLSSAEQFASEQGTDAGNRAFRVEQPIGQVGFLIEDNAYTDLYEPTLYIIKEDTIYIIKDEQLVLYSDGFTLPENLRFNLRMQTNTKFPILAEMKAVVTPANFQGNDLFLFDSIDGNVTEDEEFQSPEDEEMWFSLDVLQKPNSTSSNHSIIRYNYDVDAGTYMQITVRHDSIRIGSTSNAVIAQIQGANYTVPMTVKVTSTNGIFTFLGTGTTPTSGATSDADVVNVGVPYGIVHQQPIHTANTAIVANIKTRYSNIPGGLMEYLNQI